MSLRPFALALLLASAATPVFADGKRDLEDGIAFYDNLDTDRAAERLRAASVATDLPASDRAKAFLYLGMVLMEVGKGPEAETAWRSAFGLAPKLAVPAGTSPKVVEAIERVRRASAPSPSPKPVVTPDIAPSPKPSPTATPSPSPTVAPSPSPTVAPYAEPVPSPEPALTDAPPPPAEEDDDDRGIPAWLLWGGIGAVVVGGAVATILVVTRPCAATGGCLDVEVR